MRVLNGYKNEKVVQKVGSESFELPCSTALELVCKRLNLKAKRSWRDAKPQHFPESRDELTYLPLL